MAMSPSPRAREAMAMVHAVEQERVGQILARQLNLARIVAQELRKTRTSEFFAVVGGAYNGRVTFDIVSVPPGTKPSDYGSGSGVVQFIAEDPQYRILAKSYLPAGLLGELTRAGLSELVS